MASENLESLKIAVAQYECQLLQIQTAISASSAGSDKDSLISLATDIAELINLTKENISRLQTQATQSPSSSNAERRKDDPLADEYDLFKAEIEGLSSDKPPDNRDEENSSTSQTFNISDIQDELDALQGMKCQAPYVNHYGDTTYHNALIYCVDSIEDISSIDGIQVRVMFTNPLRWDMLPCPYYLDGECRFSGEKCRYSHGELVCFSSLQEYREPNFTAVKPGARVLAKHSDNLWHSAVVTSISEGNVCTVKLASNSAQMDVNLHDILPLDNDNDDDDGSADSSDSESDECDNSEDAETVLDSSLIEESLMRAPTTALGGWEKYTKGIGSSLMQRMGYITGMGLGKHGEGRVEPVEALVLPAGKSLDHCMNLKEQAADGENLFKVEKRLKRLKKKQERLQKHFDQRKTRQKRINIFDFINSKVGCPDIEKPATSNNNKNKAEVANLKAETSRGLNVVGFRVGEEIRKVEKDVANLQHALARHSKGSVTHSVLMSKLGEKTNELQTLKNSETNIDREKARREGRKKLCIF